MSKILITYFSASGITKSVADKIAELTGGDLFEIAPEQTYTDADLDWNNGDSRSSREMKDPSSRPKIKTKAPNLDDYDKIIIGFPIWWDLAPTIINTFIEENNLENKPIYLFATSGSSSIDNSADSLKAAYPNLDFRNARRFSSLITKHNVAAWLEEA